MKNKYPSLFGDFFGTTFMSSFFEDYNKVDFPKEDDKNFNKTVETTENETHVFKKETWVSVDGYTKMSRTTYESKSKPKETLKPTKEDLQKQLDAAVKEQDFETAIKLRDQISEFK